MLNIIIKLSIKTFFIVLIFRIFFFHNEIIYIDKSNKLSEYEENLNFFDLKPQIKAIALYLPQFHSIKENDKFWGKGFTEWTNVKKCKPLFKGHNQPRIPGDAFGYLNYYDLTNIEVIKTQVKLAKSHGIYGFGIYYYWFSGKKLLKKPIELFIKYSNINFRFLLIWANENWTKKWDGKDKDIIIKQEYFPEDPKNFIKDIKKYVKDKRYIRIEGRPILGLYEPNKIPNLRQTIEIWRNKSVEYGIGEIFILICINNNKTQDFEKLNLFNATYEFPPRNSFQNHRIPNKRTFIYTELLYKSFYFNDSQINITKLPFFRGIMLEWDNCPRMNNCEIFEHYSPEQFYMFNKIIREWTYNHYKEELRFIFINAWNEWGEGSYLEPDNKYGYSSINSLSKAIFNIPYIYKYNIFTLNKTSSIAVIVQFCDENLIKEVLTKINNIPLIFDLYIYIDSKINVDNIKKYIQANSKAHYFEIISFNTYFELILSCLYPFKDKARNYKYICNINCNNYNKTNNYEEWKNYIYNNLLGDSLIISEILTEFENKDNLGLIFPEVYYKNLYQFGEDINEFELKYINIILRKLTSKLYFTFQINDYPEGNMFWAKVKAIYPIFILYSNSAFTKKFKLMLEKYLEKVWIYLLKYTGFFYKKIFKHL